MYWPKQSKRIGVCFVLILLVEAKWPVPHLSIVIPTSRDIVALEMTLAAALEHQPDGCEVIVVNDGSYQDPYDLGDEVRFIDVAPTPNVIDLINAGSQAASAPVVHVLQTGVEVKSGWTAAALGHFDDPQVGSVAPELLLSGAASTSIRGVDHRWGGCRVLVKGAARRNERAPLGPTIWGGFYRRSAIESVGGWDPRLGMECADLDLALSLRQIGFDSVSEPQSRIRMAGCAIKEAPGFRYGRAAERLFWKHPLASWPIALTLHALRTAVGLATRLHQPSRVVAEALGRCVGATGLFSARQHRQNLEEILPPGSALPFVSADQDETITLRRAA